MGAKLLVVEDDPRNLRLVRSLLTAHGFQVSCAEDGQQGVALAMEDGPDLILMDMQLPVMNGLEATQVLQKNPGTRHIPVIALTAQAMRGDRERILQAGCSDYVTKPIDLQELLNTIHRWVGQEVSR